ncbi:MAG: ATP-dependent DNA helicase RecG [bacterium]|nr:ATP-dependent DNA helicase RecG [bacterium]
MLKLTTPLSEISGIPDKFLKRLAKLGIKTAKDLLWHFPTRYEDFSKIYSIDELIPGQQATIQGQIEKVSIRRTWKRQMLIAEAHIADQTGVIRAVWFNQPYIANTLRRGMLANFAGKVQEDDGELYLSSPAYERVRNAEPNHTARLVPIYPETKGLTSKGLRFLIKPLLKQAEQIAEWIPDYILESQNIPKINEAIANIHFPNEIEDALSAKKRFAFEELFLMQLFNLKEREALAKEKAPVFQLTIEELNLITEKLPFALTGAQNNALTEILADLTKGAPMNRLLQGDVGSGKTVIAAIASLAAAKNGYQAVFMAPTEVLAGQHFTTLQKLFAPLSQKVSLALITGSGAKMFFENNLSTDTTKKNAKLAVERGEINIVVGTHTLIQKDIKFTNLGLVVIDEQHRFGVRQRAELLTQSKEVGFIPHLLSMSATPIPRTLTLTIFGDLDLSIINEMPTGRKPILTKIVSPSNRDKAYAFIRGQVKNGKQVFVICPRIETTDDSQQTTDNKNDGTPESSVVGRRLLVNSWADVKNVTEEYEKLSKKVFPDLRVEMLHGKLPAKDKIEVMRKFQNREFDILVSTSVIEVGVDVPNATIMMIESADRFGLAQLYQFRGRVGRGEHQSFCFLFTDSSSKSTENRLKALIEAKNGFELAEMDLKLRGPGEFLGSSQTGMPDIAMRALQNMELIKEGRAAAEAVLAKSSDLKKYPSLAAKVSEFKALIHFE